MFITLLWSKNFMVWKSWPLLINILINIRFINSPLAHVVYFIYLYLQLFREKSVIFYRFGLQKPLKKRLSLYVFSLFKTACCNCINNDLNLYLLLQIINSYFRKSRACTMYTVYTLYILSSFKFRFMQITKKTLIMIAI